MSYGFQGQPFVNVPSNSGVNLNNMSYSFQAQPFVTDPSTTTAQNQNGNVGAKLIAMGLI
jgi:hypothetical protein